LIRRRRIAKRAFFHGTVKNQPRSETEVWQISSGGRPELPNFHPYREKTSGENFSRSAAGAQSKLADSREAGAAPPSAAAPGAFCHGTVKNQPRSATEAFKSLTGIPLGILFFTQQNIIAKIVSRNH
jgi:hypothetical protein